MQPGARLTLLTVLVAGLCFIICGCAGSSQATPSPTPTPNGQPSFAYVTETGAGRISIWSVDGATGKLQFTGSAATGTPNPNAIALDPSGRFAYVTTQVAPGGSDSLLMFSTDATNGALAPIAPPMPAGPTPFGIVVDPHGRFAYVANVNGTTVSIYSINSTTGLLSPIATGGVAVNQPFSIAIDPAGKFAYVLNASPSIFMFSIDQTTGALSPIGAGTIAVGGAPRAIAVDPTGRFAYVPIRNATNNGDPGDTVALFSINAGTGALTSIGTPVPTGFNPVSLAIDPTGRFVYVADLDSDDVSMFGINSSTGVLTSLGPTVATAAPITVVVDPSGKFVYVGNFGTGIREVSIYSMDTSTGTLSSVGTVSTQGVPASLAISPATTH